MDKLDKAREEICKDCLMWVKIENCRECLFNAMCDIEDKYADSDYDETDEYDWYDPMLLDRMFRD
jgi:hypothetical protein